MALTDKAFSEALIQRLLVAAYRQALPAVRAASSTLGRSLSYFVIDAQSGALTIPQYWAAYLNAGRGPFGPSSARILVYFRDPSQDPRLIHGYPVLRKNRLRLTKAEFQAGLRANAKVIAEYRRRGITDLRRIPLPMIIAKRVGPASGKHFFSNAVDGGMAGYAQTADRIIKPAFDRHVRESIAEATRRPLAPLVV